MAVADRVTDARCRRRAQCALRCRDGAARNAEALWRSNLYRGYQVVTTLDSRLQKAANYALRNGLLEFTRRRGYRGPIRTFELTPEILATPFEEWPVEIRQTLEQYAPGGLSVALVTAVNERQSAHRVLRDGSTDYSVARNQLGQPVYRSRDYGPAPETAAEVLAPGDVIFVMPTTQGTGRWRRCLRRRAPSFARPAGWRDQQPGRRLRFCDQQIQSRDAGLSPARLFVQAVYLLGGARTRQHAGHGRSGRARRH